MKKRILLFIFSILFISCEDVIDIDLPTAEPRLVIDANFNIFLNQPSLNLNNFIRLTLTGSFFDENVPVVNNATVFIIDKDDNITFNFSELNESGIYVPETDIVPEIDAIYELNVVYKGETYRATANFIPTVPIDSVVKGDTKLFNGDETEVVVSFTDNATRDDYYLFDLDFGLFLTTEDEFYNGETFVFSYFYDNVIEGQDIDINISGVDKQFYNYLTLIIEQNGQNGGGPFQTTPATVRGNIVNITNPDNYPLGYFSISEANNFNFTLE